jgi:pimeloyl-ACP methyl ester carboxylesterase
MRQEHFQSLANGSFHRIAYTDWGDAANPHVVVCVHGLARNSRDFDYLAAALASDCRIVCMDVAGRGESEWLENKSNYTFSTYQSDAAAMLARATGSASPSWLDRLRGDGATKLDWVGTSMGGLIGMFLAAKRNSPIRRLVLNDVGALIPWSALFRMKGYITRGKRFAGVEGVEAYLRDVCAPFGPLTDEQWRHLAFHSASRGEGAQASEYYLRYDPAIGDGLHGHIDPEFPIGPDMLRGIDLWNVWSKVTCPTLVLRGAQSEVLLPKTLQEMRSRKPDLEVVEFEGVGHAPALMSEDQIQAVKSFLLK